MKLSTLLLMLCYLALSGCDATTFESVPAGATGDCAANWPGGWIALDEQGQDDPDFALFINSKCEIENVTAKNKSDSALLIKPQFFNAAQHYAILGIADGLRLADSTDDAKNLPAQGYFIMRWDYDNQRMALRLPAHKLVATLIVNGAIDGSVIRERTARTLRNNVAGDPAQIHSLLQNMDLFGDSAPAHLRWTGPTRKALDTTLAKLRKQKADAERHASAQPSSNFRH